MYQRLHHIRSCLFQTRFLGGPDAISGYCPHAAHGNYHGKGAHMKPRHWASLFLLGLGGQIAFAIENQFFNTFMYDKILPRPLYVSLMVAASAVVATLTAIGMGAFSDRVGRRRPFLLFGYLIWGVSIVAVPTAEFITVPVLAAWALIALDCVMTFFGSTAYDACYNAYLTDITDLSNRGKAQGIFSLSMWLAMLIVYGASGEIIRRFDYFFFFAMVGVIVFISGLAGGLLVEDRALPAGRDGVSTIRRIVSTFNRGYLNEHRGFFTVLLAMGLWGMAFEVFFPFLLIYLKHYLKLPLETSTLLIFVSILVGGILSAIPAGMLSDRFGRKKIAVAAIVVEAVCLFLFASVNGAFWLALCATGWISAYNFWMIATLAWSKDLYPDDRRGEFSGYTTFFTVAFTMIPGPLIGGLIVERYGIKTLIEGREGVVPTPEIFMIAALMMMLPLIPVLRAKEKKKEDEPSR